MRHFIRFAAAICVCVGMFTLFVVNEAGASTTGTGSCSITLSGTWTPPTGSTTGLSGDIACTGLSIQPYEVFGADLGSYTVWIQVQSVWSSNVPATFDCPMVSGVFTLGGSCPSAIIGVGLSITTATTAYAAWCSYPTGYFTACGSNAYGVQQWQDGVTPTISSTVATLELASAPCT